MDHMQRFVADAAHELRTPLTVVRTRAEVALQRTREPEEYRDALVGIEREAERVGHIVEDLLTLARADAGVRRIDRQRVFLDDVLMDAVDAARPLADRKHVKLDVEEFEEAPVHGDRALLRQLSLILLDNAIKFCDERGTVRVAVRALPTGAELIVADDGPGIPADQLPHVFDRFYRGNAARTRDPAGASEGAGLGLSIARWIADEHHASIRIRSDAGRGTRVVVEFPLALDAVSSS
jgi:signal transduction histidine kinase